MESDRRRNVSLMKANGHRRGSVLMEFIIVFPIYLILFAWTVAIGDMLIHSNRLISADRVAVFDVDRHEGGDVSGTSAWNTMVRMAFHPGVEIADDGLNQDTLSQKTEARYADKTGPWSVCALSTTTNSYKILAGGALGQLLAAQMLVGGGGSNFLDRAAGGLNMVSKDTRNGASFYTLKRRDNYKQRNVRRKWGEYYIDEDSTNWRDRNFVSRLLRRDANKIEYWRSEVANEGWHTADTINGRVTSCSEASGTRLGDYERYSEFVKLSK